MLSKVDSAGFLPKVALPCEVITETTFLQYHCEWISAYQHYSRIATGDSNLTVPLIIMTSEDTHNAILGLLNSANFGHLDITVMKQEKVPAFINNRAVLALTTATADGGHPCIVTKPHGHGDVHSLLFSTGIVDNLVRTQGVEYFVLLQDTNPLTYRSVLCALGESSRRSLLINLLAVSRKPKEQVGAICEILDENGVERTCCIEYNELDPLLKNVGNGLGDVAVSPTCNESPFAGNINIIIVKAKEFVSVLNETKGIVPEFANPKIKNEFEFASPARLECMMQDICLFYPKDQVGYTEFERFVCFSPMKNNIRDAALKYASTGYAESASSMESDFYSTGRRLLAMAGCEVKTSYIPIVRFSSGIPFEDGAKVVLFPRFGISMNEIRKRFPCPENVEISNRSSLVLDGDVIIEKLKLNGHLKIKAGVNAKIVVKNLTVDNLGVHFEYVDENNNEKDGKMFEKIRGYKKVMEESLEIVVINPGEVIIDR